MEGAVWIHSSDKPRTTRSSKAISIYFHPNLQGTRCCLRNNSLTLRSFLTLNKLDLLESNHKSREAHHKRIICPWNFESLGEVTQKFITAIMKRDHILKFELTCLADFHLWREVKKFPNNTLLLLNLTKVYPEGTMLCIDTQAYFNRLHNKWTSPHDVPLSSTVILTFFTMYVCKQTDELEAIKKILLLLMLCLFEYLYFLC